MGEIDLTTPIIVGIIFTYYFLKYNKFSKLTALIIVFGVNSFFIFDIINSLFNVWEDFYILKNILVLLAALMGTYISIKKYRNNTLAGAHKILAYMSFYIFIMMIACAIIFVLGIVYMKLMIYLK